MLSGRLDDIAVLSQGLKAAVPLARKSAGRWKILSAGVFLADAPTAVGAAH